MKILLLENDKDVAVEWETVLIGAGHEVTIFEYGEDVIRRIDRLHQYEGFIIDIGLNGDCSGLDVLEKIRNFSYKTPTIVLTSSTNESDARRLFGIDPKVPYLSKLIHTAEHPETTLFIIESWNENKGIKVVSLYGYKFHISLATDFIWCIYEDGTKKKLMITTHKYQILRLLLENYMKNGDTVVVSKEEIVNKVGCKASSVEPQMVHIRKELPADVAIPNHSGGYNFEKV